MADDRDLIGNAQYLAEIFRRADGVMIEIEGKRVGLGKDIILLIARLLDTADLEELEETNA